MKKMLRRAIAVGTVAALAGVGLATQAGADHTEPRFSLAIAPNEGPVGTPINAVVPPEYQDVCETDLDVLLTQLQDVLSAAVTEALGEADPFATQILNALQTGIDSLTAEDLDNFAFLFRLLFVDPATTDPVGDSAEWSAQTGTGTIPAQDAPRPANYLVSAVCLGLLPSIDAEALLTAVNDFAEGRITEILTILGTAAVVCDPGFIGPPGNNGPGACLATLGIANPADIASTITALTEELTALITEVVETLIGDLVPDAVDRDPDVAWVASYCLFGDDGTTCAEGAAPAPVPVAAFTG